MIELADIVAKYGGGYVNEFSDRMLPSHKRALADKRLNNKIPFRYGLLESDGQRTPLCEGLWFRSK